MKATIMILALVLMGCATDGLKGDGIVYTVEKKKGECWCYVVFPKTTMDKYEQLWIACPESTSVGDTIEIKVK